MKLLNRFLSTEFMANIMIAIDKKKRRKTRPNYYTDQTDPFFIFRTEEYIKSIDADLADKLKVKDYVKDFIGTPKTLFTWDQKGNLTKGSLPKTGKVILKSNNGSGYVKVVEVSKINQKLLRKIYKEWWYNSKVDKYYKGEKHYKKIETVLFGEEFLEGDIVDYKVHLSADGSIATFLTCSERDTGRTVFKEYDSNGKSIYGADEGFFKPEVLDKNIKKIFDQALIISRKIQKNMNHYARFDYYYNNGQLLLGEITFTTDGGRVYGKNEPSEKDAMNFTKMIQKK